MSDLSLQELLCFCAVVEAGSFQAAADSLHRTHPTVFNAIKNLEQRLELRLLDRSGYRVALTPEGQSFYRQTRQVLDKVEGLQRHAQFLAAGEETELRIVIGDLCSLPEMLAKLKRFFDDCPATRLHLQFETLTGPVERLMDNDADLILHHIDQADARMEFVALNQVSLLPVVAPGFLTFAIHDSITPEQMRDYVQCILRDTATHTATRDYHLISGAHSWTVSDQFMKKELILQGMGWGNMPVHLIREELDAGRLLSICGRYFKESTLQIVAARRSDRAHGPVARRLWDYLQH
ncbi:MAG: LysR family transcriptional regulator [Burkholderiales bacterium]|nr:LysR family transcriptional regulator [Burkholderiales bacterium]